MIALALIVLYIAGCVAVLVWIGRVKHHTPIVYYRCGVCGLRMSSPEAWEQHQADHATHPHPIYRQER